MRNAHDKGNSTMISRQTFHNKLVVAMSKCVKNEYFVVDNHIFLRQSPSKGHFFQSRQSYVEKLIWAKIPEKKGGFRAKIDENEEKSTKNEKKSEKDLVVSEKVSTFASQSGNNGTLQDATLTQTHGPFVYRLGREIFIL